jgi:hypothetical protein
MIHSTVRQEKGIMELLWFRERTVAVIRKLQFGRIYLRSHLHLPGVQCRTGIHRYAKKAMSKAKVANMTRKKELKSKGDNKATLSNSE